MRTDDIQYIALSGFIDELNSFDQSINKQAFDLSTIKDGLGQAAQTIMSDFKSSADQSGGPGKAVLHFLEEVFITSTLWRLGIIGKVIVFLTQALNINISEIINSILAPIKPKLENNEPITEEELNATRPVIVTAEFYGLIVKEAQRWRSSPSWYQRVFEPISQVGKGTFLKSFIWWVIKTVLLGSGLLVGGYAVRKMLGLDKPAPAQSGQSAQQTPHPALQASGFGEETNTNTSTVTWIVPLYGDIRNTLLQWAIKVYPELQGHQSTIVSTPSFNRTVNKLQENFDSRAPNYLTVPQGYNRIIDIVDTFAGDVAAKIATEKGQI